jgi:hypothetical protein
MLPGTRYVSMMLRGGFVLALLLGLSFWTGILSATGGVVLVHMLLGLIVVASVWYLGLAQAQAGGGFGLTAGTFIVGLALAFYGLSQVRLLEDTWHLSLAVVGTGHLLLALLAVGLGEMSGARIRRGGPASAKAARR